jgi:glucose/arabinose dehydrogenase
MKKLYAIIIIAFVTLRMNAQPIPVSLHPDVSISLLMNVNLQATRIDRDPITGELYYATASGDIYKIVRPAAGLPYDTLIADTNLHGVTYVQGMCFHDSSIYISGNIHAFTPMTSGIVSRGRLQPDGSRIWNVVAISEPYETADYFDHLFSGSIVNPTGDSIYINSGARGDHGEIQTRYGLYSNIRNKALTSCILKIPIDADSLIIPDDSLALDAANLVLCRGIRNTYDFAYNSLGDLFGSENSGDRDMDDELNWIRPGHHYGFPWVMGQAYNPQQFAGFDSSADIMINHTSTSWLQGFFTNDSLFPQIPPGLTLTAPCLNYGPDGDQFRDSTNGMIMDASDLGIAVSSFTAHRSPLGLVFDTDSILNGQFRGSGFVTCYTRGDSSYAGYSTLLAPLADPGEDILHLEMVKDSLADNYTFHATRIAGGFPHPVDMVLDSNVLYLIEVSYGGTASLWAITLPSFNVSVGENNEFNAGVYPNPANEELLISCQSSRAMETNFTLATLEGKQVMNKMISSSSVETHQSIDTSTLPAGLYLATFSSSVGSKTIRISIIH